MSTIFLVQSEPGFWVRAVAGHAREAGHRPVLLTAPLTDAQRRAAAETVDDVIELDDVTDPEALAAAVRELSDDGRIMTCADSVMIATTRAAELLGVAQTPAGVFANIRNKYEARRVMTAAGLRSPRFALIHGADQAPAVAQAVGLPAVIKPVNGAASHLVRAVDTVEELADAYTRMAARTPGSIRAMYDRPLGPLGDLDPTRSFLVESMLDGPEYAIDVIVRDGVVETLKIVGKPLMEPGFLEVIMLLPPFDLSADADARLRREAGDAVLALGLRDAVAHVEVIDDKDAGPTVVEVNAGRPGGGILGVMHELTSGVRLFAECLHAVLGEPPPSRTAPKITIPVASSTVFGTGSGRLVRIHGLEEAADLPEVLDVLPVAEPGQILGGDHEIFIVNLLLTGFFDTEELIAVHQEIVKLIRLETEPVEPAEPNEPAEPAEGPGA